MDEGDYQLKDLSTILRALQAQVSKAPPVPPTIYITYTVPSEYHPTNSGSSATPPTDGSGKD